MKISSSFNTVFNNAKEAFARFPITMIWAIIGTFYTVWYVDQRIEHRLEHTFIRVILTMILGLSWLIASRLLVQYYKEEESKKMTWLSFVVLALLLVYYLTLPSDKESFDSIVVPYRFTLFIISGHLAVFVTPFIFKWDKYAYWNYVKNVFAAFATSTFFSIVLYLGLVLALLAMKFLFRLEIKDIRYFELFIIAIGIVNTWIFVSDLPEKIHQDKLIDYPKALEVFVKYILIPLTVLYLIILYAYSIKIVLRWDLPRGWVSYLIIALSILGFLIHILINPIKKIIDSVVINKFYPWFYYALLPMLILLFVAIFKRIFSYGITENRYLVLVIALWITGMTLYILFSKRKKLKNLFMSIAIITLFISFGFWGIFSVSINSQVKEFDNLYTSMKTADFKVKSDEKYRFESIIHYLGKRNAISKLEQSLGFNPNEVFETESYWQIADKLSDSLQIEVTDRDLNQFRSNYHYYSIDNASVLDIKGYDFMKRINFFRDELYVKHPRVIERNQQSINQYTFKLDTVSALLIRKDSSLIHKLDLFPMIHKLDKNNDQGEVSSKKFSIEKEYDDIKVKVLFENMEINYEDKKVPKIANANGFVLLKIKRLHEE